MNATRKKTNQPPTKNQNEKQNIPKRVAQIREEAKTQTPSALEFVTKSGNTVRIEKQAEKFKVTKGDGIRSNAPLGRGIGAAVSSGRTGSGRSPSISIPTRNGNRIGSDSTNIRTPRRRGSEFGSLAQALVTNKQVGVSRSEPLSKLNSSRFKTKPLNKLGVHMNNMFKSAHPVGLNNSEEVRGIAEHLSTHGSFSNRMTFEGVDFLEAITVPSGTLAGRTVYKIDLNPALYNRTRCAGISQFFLRVEMKEMGFCFEPVQAATQGGALAMAMPQDPDLVIPSGVEAIRELATNPTFVQFPVWKAAECVTKFVDRTPKYVAVDQQTDPRLTEFGSFYLIAASDYAAEVAAGNLYIWYKLEMENPQLTFAPKGGGYCQILGKSITNWTDEPFGTPLVEGNLGIQDVTNTISAFLFPPGFYVVTFSMQFTGGGAAPSLIYGAAMTEITSSPYERFYFNNTFQEIRLMCVEVAYGSAADRTLKITVPGATSIYENSTDNTFLSPCLKITTAPNGLAQYNFCDRNKDVFNELQILRNEILDIKREHQEDTEEIPESKH